MNVHVNNAQYLSALFGADLAEDILNSHPPDKVTAFHGSLERLQEIKAAPELKDIYALLKAVEESPRRRDADIQAWFQDKNGAHQQIKLDPVGARKLYGSGNVTIAVNSVHLFSEAVYNLLYGIESELDGMPSRPTVNAYASPKGVGTLMHFDAQDNLSIQLAGQKEWKVAPNKQIKFPDSNFVHGKPVPADHALAPFIDKFPKTMPSDSETHLLKPGSAMFFPKGYWHETLTIEESFALTFTFTVPNWHSIIMAALSKRLVLEESFRTPLYDVFRRDTDLPGQIKKRMKELQVISSSDGLESTIHRLVTEENPCYWKNGACTATLKRSGDGGVLVVTKNNEDTEIKVKAKHIVFIEWILNRKKSVRLPEAMQAMSKDSSLGEDLEPSTKAMLEFLTSLGVLIKRQVRPFSEYGFGKE